MPTLNWIGKEKVQTHHLDVPYRVMEHGYGFTAENGEQFDPVESGNKIIYGDNLEALKSLLPFYEGKVDCIYIDPPYNTGNEQWVYNDNVNHPKIKKWLGQVVGKESEDLSRHDKWLCMMYPRLQLLKQLLSDTGVIFISIDDNEQANLKLICDEIFGERNFLGNIIWNSRKSVSNDALISLNHNHSLLYCKHRPTFDTVKSDFKLAESTDGFANPDNDPKGLWKADPFDSPGIRPNLTYPIINPNTGDEYLPPNGRCWRTGESEYKQFLADGRIIFGKTGNSKPQLKRYYSEANEKGRTTKSIWDDVDTATHGTKEIMQIFNGKVFDTPKPTGFIQRVLELCTNKNSIVLDSFAGSATTAHAVLNLNKKDGGSRKFILVELEDYANDITAERVKRVIEGYGEGNNAVEGTGGNFNFYTLGQSLLDDERNLNIEMPMDAVCSYIWYTETHTAYEKGEQSLPLLGVYQDRAYYLNYIPNEVTTLDRQFLKNIDVKANQYVIYADNCLLPKELMQKYNIIFKKIPRDISQF